jgi:mannose-6-phosphate isomerase-like protein (cupin superfamily)
MRVVNIEAMMQRVHEPWKPHSVGQVNDCLVKVVKLQGPFVWHHHETEDEMFLVIHGTLRMHFRDDSGEREALVGPGEFIIVPRGTEHMPVADEEVHLMLFEPATTVNTGSAGGERTVSELPTL